MDLAAEGGRKIWGISIGVPPKGAIFVNDSESLRVRADLRSAALFDCSSKTLRSEEQVNSLQSWDLDPVFTYDIVSAERINMVGVRSVFYNRGTKHGYIVCGGASSIGFFTQDSTQNLIQLIPTVSLSTANRTLRLWGISEISCLGTDPQRKSLRVRLQAHVDFIFR